jgi:hypothetical protein
MNFIKVLDKLADKELLATKGSRRDSFQKITNFGKDMALASIPFALAATNNKTRAATMSMTGAAMQADPIAILNFALTLEYLERNFYNMGVSTSGLIPASDAEVFQTIADHETSHVDFLVAALGADAIDEPTFDFTAGGAFPDVFTNYQTFAALAQAFEDTGVRAYKGQVGGLANNNDLLTYAVQIHSVEARHASQIRRMRGDKGWIVQNDNSSLPGATDPIYAGEQNTEQAGVDLSGIIGGADAASAAFDEPLTMDQVNAVATLFIV